MHPYEERELNAASLMQFLHLTSINLQGKRRGAEDLGSRWEKRDARRATCHGWQNKRLPVALPGLRGGQEGNVQLKLKTGNEPEFLGFLLRKKIFTSARSCGAATSLEMI